MTNPPPLTATCHCGAVMLQIPTAPDYINECNCSLCDSHGVWWGYFAPDNVTVTGHTQGYSRSDKRAPVVTIQFCGTCGCTTHFRTTEGFVERTGVDNIMGVNMRLFQRLELAGVELRYPDGKNWNGVGQWEFMREAIILS